MLLQPDKYQWVAVCALAALGSAGASAHAPHDNVYSLATAPASAGGLEYVACSELQTARVSRDGMLTWELLTGEGLEDQRPVSVTWNPTYPNQHGEKGAFLIGTESGIWVHENGADPTAAYSLSDGLDLDTLNAANFRHLATAVHSSPGSWTPSFALSKNGTLYRLRSDFSGWDAVHAISPVNYGGIAIAPGFDETANGREASVWVASDNELYLSTAGGVSGTFNLVEDMGALGWAITALAVEHDYGTNPDGLILMGLGRLAAGPPGDEGELWISGDEGLNWTNALSMGSSVFSVVSMPAGPTQGPAILAAAREFPGANSYEDGVFQSLDRGNTWDDHDNLQGFLREHLPGTYTGYEPLRYRQHMHVAHDFATSGQVLWGRNEGLWVSEQEGVSWLELHIRDPRETRRVSSAVDAQGNLIVGAGTYGSGPLVSDLGTGTDWVHDTNTGWLFCRAVRTSPDFANDGTMFICASGGVYGWFDPDLPPNNVFDKQGLTTLPLVNATSGERLIDNIRNAAVSPSFSAAPGAADQVVYMSGWAGSQWRSMDAGQTYEDVGATEGGITLPQLTDIEVAPTFDPTPPHDDVYAIGFGGVYRLSADVWTPLFEQAGTFNDLELHPDFGVGGNRTVWVASDVDGRILDIDDQPGAVTVGEVPKSGLPRSRIAAIDSVVDASGDVWLYAATFSVGVYKLNLTAGSDWERLSDDGRPQHWSQGMELAADWSTSGRIFLGTAVGLYVLSENDAVPTWEPVFDALVQDDWMPQVATWTGPADPDPADPAQPWPWLDVPNGRFPGGAYGEDGSIYTVEDGAVLQADGWARSITIRTVSGPRTAAIDLEATDLETGAVIATDFVDLQPITATQEAYELEWDLGTGTARPVRIRVTVTSPSDEAFAFDWISFEE